VRAGEIGPVAERGGGSGRRWGMTPSETEGERARRVDRRRRPVRRTPVGLPKSARSLEASSQEAIIRLRAMPTGSYFP
jgi:hypothetical protein